MRTLTTLVLLLPLLLSGSACVNAGEGPQGAARLKLRTESRSHQGYLGVGIQDLRPSQAREMKLPVKTGALIDQVEEGSPAAEAGLEEHDVVIEFNKATIDDAADLTQAVRKTEPGTKTSLTVLRDGQKKVVQVTVGSLPAPRELSIVTEAPRVPIHMNFFSANEVQGLALMELNAQLADYFGTAAGKGVLVEEVRKRSAAKEAGFKAGDVILRVGEDEITEVNDVHAALDGLQEGDTVAVAVLRRGAPVTLHMEVDGTPTSGIYFRQGSRNVPHVVPDMRGFQLDRMKMQHDLQQLQEHLRSVGREIRGKVERLRMTVRRDLRSAMS